MTQHSPQIYTCDNLNGTIVAEADQHGNETTTYRQFGCIVTEVQLWIDGTNYPQ